MLTNSGESPLLERGNSVAARDDRSEDVALHSHTERKRDDIEQEKIGGVGGRGLARENTSLNSSTIGDSLIRVNALLELLTVEEVAKELLYPGNTCAATNQDDLVNLALLERSILQDLLNGLDCAVESLAVDVLESGAGDVGVEVLAVEERIDLDRGLGAVGQSTLGAFASSSQTAEGTWVVRHVLCG